MENKNNVGVQTVLPKLTFSAENVEMSDGTRFSGVNLSVELGEVTQSEESVRTQMSSLNGMIQKAVEFWQVYAEDQKDKRKFKYAVHKMKHRVENEEKEKQEEDFEQVK